MTGPAEDGLPAHGAEPAGATEPTGSPEVADAAPEVSTAAAASTAPEASEAAGEPGEAAGEAGADDKDGADEGARPGTGWRRAVIEIVAAIAVAALVAWGVQALAVETFFIPSASMTPTLAVHDRILVQKAFFSWHDIREGDMVVFHAPAAEHCGGDEGGDLVKRVIGLPGQVIYSWRGIIYVNYKPLSEPYLPKADPLGPAIASPEHPYTVPAGDFFVLGDNRSDSCDSRYWGPVSGPSVIGKVVATIWHDGHPEFNAY